MQKKIIALAVAGLVSGAAFAQSNVTVYGVMDVGVAKYKDVSLGATANGTANDGTSRLGFKGSEDLGGGLKANFNIEQAVNLANGATNATTFDRQAWMGLSGGFGELQIGRNYTAGFKTMASYDATGMANYSAAVRRLNIGKAKDILAGDTVGGLRQDAQVLYISPNMGGLTVMFGHVLKGNSAAVPADSQNEIGVTYVNGPIAAGLAWADNGNGSKDKSLGGSFNFGMGRAVAGYYDMEGAQKGYSLGVADIKAGPMLLGLEWAKDTGSAGKPKATVLNAKYPLSKRTFAYAVYSDFTEKAGDFWSLGVRHNF